jgi:hypothetical protein
MLRMGTRALLWRAPGLAGIMGEETTASLASLHARATPEAEDSGEARQAAAAHEQAASTSGRSTGGAAYKLDAEGMGGRGRFYDTVRVVPDTQEVGSDAGEGGAGAGVATLQRAGAAAQPEARSGA